MAEENTENKSTPGIGMRMTISMISKKFSKAANISTNTLSDWMRKEEEAQKLVLLDCRPEEEYVVSRIPGAVRVDYENEAESILEKIPDAQTDKSARIVCYCAAGYRSSLVVEKIQDHFKKLGTKPPWEMYNLEGSIFKWANEGRTMVDVNNKRTPFAHPYNAVFGKLLESHLRRQDAREQNEEKIRVEESH
ncbi:uncharacterized protein LOC127712560 [Mytilus californianus]|uniref:uncharacterized protein LOC127712560 n=1 Tax=Mytilus californianus TaxID=6549 RepID=UPI0022464154|nr:uncharacterized protein LOC127712560 [Mytilus californianus]